MGYQQISSSDSLKNYIKCFWYTDRIFNQDNSNFDILPDCFAELIFFYDAVCSVENADGPSVALSSPFIVGLLDRPVRLKIEGHIKIFALRFYPWAIFPLLKMNPQTNEDFHYHHHSFHSLSELLQRNISQEPVSTILEFLKDYFIGYFSGSEPPDAFVHSAGNRILANQGTQPVHRLAVESLVTQKTLERKLKKTSGNTAKALAQKIRFETIRNHIWSNPDCSLKKLALEYEFTDAAHFHREFKKFSGKSPSGFARDCEAAKTLLSQKNVEIIQP